MTNLATFAPVLADTDGWGHMNGWGGGWMWLWGTLMMFSWVAIIVVAMSFTSRSRGNSTRQTPAKAILDERYARGDLTTEEYRERLDQLS